ncbi:MAG: AMP-binding enzyme, partial [Mycobacteriaceae bacterium]
VVGVADSEGLDKPVALAVLDQRHPPVTEDELIAWCRDGLASFKRPRRVVFVEALPKTATGKLQRFRVKEQLTAYFDTESEGAAASPPVSGVPS